MPMPAYPVLCYAPGCDHPAAYKVAACWTDGTTGELKTYFLACPDCVGPLLAAAEVKHSICRVAPGEKLGVPGIYELNRGSDSAWKRCPELEASLKEAAVTS